MTETIKLMKACQFVALGARNSSSGLGRDFDCWTNGVILEKFPILFCDSCT